MNDLDEWAAEQCGVICHSTYWHLTNQSFIEHEHQWTLSDPRCMQVFREKFRFDTEAFSTDGWECYHRDMDKFFSGKTIAEAEIACAKAIYAARGSDE